MVFYLLFLGTWAVALRPYLPGLVFPLSLMLALAQVSWHFSLIRERSRDGCFKAFRLNHWLGCTVFAGVALSYLLYPLA